MVFLRGLLLAIIFAWPVFAQAPTYLIPVPKGPSVNDSPVTVTNSNGIAIAAGNYTNAKFSNQSSTDTIYCRWGQAAVATATAGQYTFSPNGGGYIWSPQDDPPPLQKALNCISSGASSPGTVRAY